MDSFTNANGAKLVYDMIEAIAENTAYLSDIDGEIGDGDHGINMNKGFAKCKQKLQEAPGNLTHSLKTLYQTLIEDIGGSMGPLYGYFFRGMFKKLGETENIDKIMFGEMLNNAIQEIAKVSPAKAGDKTLIDTLAAAAEAYAAAVSQSRGFAEALDDMCAAAQKGRDSTKDMMAKLGRASRLGERSIGVLDAGATSCCLLLCTMAKSIRALLQQKAPV